MKIYVDLDSTLADFEAMFLKHTGISPEVFKNNFERKHPGEDYAPTFWKVIKEIPGFWEEMPFTNDGQRLWDYISGHNPTILTALPEIVETLRAKIGKKVWVTRNLGEDIPILFVVNSRSNYKYSGKEMYCESKDDVLIDDSIDNIKAWNNAGGKGILFKNAGDTILKLKKIGV